jgi:NAD(P)-dependent dehydrogenase (short-subunit alcohol dehydrogenase family)
MSELFDRFRLDGRTALVTGIGPGIGEHVARAYAAAGARVVMCARSTDKVEALAASIAANGHEALAVTADVGKGEDVERLVAATHDRFGPVHILFNNANASSGMGLNIAPLQLTDDDWSDHVNVNLLAPYRLARALVPDMVAAGYGRIVNVLSTAGFTPVPDIGGIAYGATKAGLAMMTRYLAKECAPVVRANMLCPGTIDAKGETRPMWVQNMPSVPLGRVGAADEVVGVALLLASEASSYITGQVIFVDGGRVSTAS